MHVARRNSTHWQFEHFWLTGRCAEDDSSWLNKGLFYGEFLFIADWMIDLLPAASLFFPSYIGYIQKKTYIFIIFEVFVARK